MTPNVADPGDDKPPVAPFGTNVPERPYDPRIAKGPVPNINVEAMRKTLDTEAQKDVWQARFFKLGQDLLACHREMRDTLKTIDHRVADTHLSRRLDMDHAQGVVDRLYNWLCRWSDVKADDVIQPEEFVSAMNGKTIAEHEAWMAEHTTGPPHE